MKTRVIHTRFWEDEKVADLSKDAKFFFIYLLTNSRINQIGIFELSDRVIIFETGLNTEELSSVKKELEDSLRVIFRNSWIFVVNAMKHQSYTGVRNDIAKEKEARLIPEDIVVYLHGLGFEIPYRYSIDTPRTKKQETKNQTQDDEEINLDDIPF